MPASGATSGTKRLAALEGTSHWPQTLLAAGALAGGLAVACGAAGAHALQSRFVAQGEHWWALANQFHAMHALATLAAAWCCDRWPRSLAARAAGTCFLLGIVLFSGGLYLRAVGSDLPLALLTPVGGAIWMVGWLSLAFSPWQSSRR